MAKKKNKKSPETEILEQISDVPSEVLTAKSDESTVESIVEATVETIDESTVDSNSFASEVFVELVAADVTADAEVEKVEASTESSVELSSEPAVINPLLITDHTQIKQVLEATIFAAPKAMSTIRLRNLLNHFNYDSSQMNSILDELITDSADKGFQLVKVAGGYQFRTHPEHSEVLQKLLEDKPARLSASALEVLAITAYKQPVSRGDIDTVRGVDSGHLMKGLLEKNLVRTLGHAETAGRPLLYGTTPYFLEVFSLGSLDDLPQMDELKRELAPSADGSSEDSENSGAFGLLMGDENFMSPDSSGLAANPNRGDFDQPFEENTHSADFGLADRAREEVNAPTEAEAQ